ncbi:unnamed protein product [Paramecium sonneborni]|uniref:Uncharacterized protein n=1 Tax=Paramecium sonneborni TaxID=65129 RepID=A0A8S1KVI3_9CILI|nr:unnamed protein product [Paramecium sonneborni]
MFESLLEKVLNSVLGQFIEGFDAQNLHIGIWSGEVIISNVSLKAEIIKMLELPIRLCFSHIGKLKLNVPWKSLTSSPVEVMLTDLYIIISADHPDVWQYINYTGFKKKMEVLEKFKESIIQNINDKSKQKDDKEDGYVKKLVLKIIDNLQLSISNIHIRFEDTIKNEFAWGFSIKKIETFTCNSEWKKQYFDRNKEENKKVALQKLLILENIGAYWNQQEKIFLNSQEKEVILKEMEEMIINTSDPKSHPKYGQFVLLLNAQGRLYQNTSGKFDSPEFCLSVELSAIDIALENLQLQQIIRMAELFSLYQNRLNQQKKQKLCLSNQQIEDQKLQFIGLYEKILRSPDQSIKALTKDENDLFEQSVSNLNIEVLCEAAKEIIKVVQKELAIKEAEEKKKKQGGWFSWGKKKDSDLLEQKEKDDLSSFIDQLADFQDIKDTRRPADYVWLSVLFSLKTGSVHILKKFNNRREGIQLIYCGFDGSFEMKDSGMMMKLGLQFIGIDIVTEPIQNGIIMYSEQKRIAFLQQINNQKFIDFVFQTNPSHLKGVDKYIKLQTEALKLIFNPIILVRINQFIDFQVKDETLKSAAWDQMEIAQDLAAQQMVQSQLSPSILFIDVKIKSTIILVPLPNSNENWLLNIGDVSIITPKIDELHYDNFEISLQDFTFKHYNQIEECHKSINKGIFLENIDGSYSIIQNIRVIIRAQILRGCSKPPKELPQIIIDGELPQLDIFVNPNIYSKILKIEECFVESIGEYEEVLKKQTRLSIDKAQTEKTVLYESATKVGKIWKRGQLLTWSQYIGVLSGGYIYLFVKIQDQQPEYHFWVKNSEFIDISEEEAGMNNAFQIKNKYGDTFVAFDKLKMANDWKEEIEKLRTMPRVQKNNVETIQSEKTKESRPLNFKFGLKGFGIHIQDEKQQDWLKVIISGLNAGANVQGRSINLDLKLRDLYVIDYIQMYMNPLLKYIVKSDPDPESNELINISIQQISKSDKKYNKKNFIIEVTFGSLSMIAKPLVIAKLLDFITPPKNQVDDMKCQGKDNVQQLQNQAKIELENNTQQQNVNFDNMQDIILIDINVKIRSINAILVHRFTTLPLAEINIQNTEIGLIKYVDEIQLNGSLGNLQLFDLTNYPNTLSKESEYKLINPKQMIGVKHQQQSLLKVQLNLLSEGSQKIVNNVNIIINVDMSQLIIHVMMQPVLRLLDYTLQQLLFALSNPKQTINPIIKQQKIEQEYEQDINQYHQLKIQENRSQTILLTEAETLYLTKQFQNPPAMQLNVVINNPQVILKPNQESESAMVIDLGTIIVSNKRNKVTNRIIKQELQLDSVWVDEFILNMKDIQLYQQSRENKREFSLPFDFNISVEIFGMFQQYQLFYPKIKFDEQLKIHCFIAPMILQITHSDYMFLMKCLFHNIAYDDGFDNMIRNSHSQYFEAFFQQQKQQELKLKEMLLTQNDQPQLSFQLDMENLSLFLLKDIKPKPIPFLRMNLIMMRVSFLKCNNGSAKVGLLIRDLEGSNFQSTKQGQFNELPFIGSMNLQQTYTYEQVTNLNGLVRGRQATLSNANQILNLASRGMLTQQQQRQLVFKFEDAYQQIEDNPQYKLIFNLEMKITGDKDINIELSDFKLQIHAGPLFDVLALIAMDDPDLTPSPGKYILFQQQIQQNALQQQEQIQVPQNPQQGYLQIRVNLRNVITCIPTQIEQNVLTVRGKFGFTMKMTPQKSVKEIEKEIKQNNIPKSDWSKLNETMKIEANLQKLEIFLCKSYDLNKKDDFKQVKKREILNPIELELNLSKSSVILQNFQEFIESIDLNGKISPINLKVSFQDLFTIKEGLNYQLSQMPNQLQNQQQEINQDKKNDEISQLDASHLNKMSLSAVKLDLEIEKIKVIVLNDMGSSYSPLFDYETDELRVTLDKNNLFLEFNITLPFKLSNFNPLCSKWEPIIEKTGFQVAIFQDTLQGLGGDISNLVTIEQMKEFDNCNLTLSTICIQSILRTQKIIEKIFNKQPCEIAQNLQKSIATEEYSPSLEDNIIQVSPYAIRNLTGYPIVVEFIDNTRLPTLNIHVNQQQNLIFDDELKTATNGQRRVNVTIKVDQQPFYIKLIDLDRYSNRFYEQDQLYAYANVILDQISNQKIVNVFAPIVITNKTNKQIILSITDDKHQQTVKLNPKKIDSGLNYFAPIPLGYMNPRISLRFSECQEYTEDILVQRLIRQLDQNNEIETRDGQFIIFKINQDKDHQGKLDIQLQTPFKITNSLPVDIYIQMMNHNKETTFTKKLKRQQSIEDYQHGHYKCSYLRVYIEGYYWSDEFKLQAAEELQQTNDECISKIVMNDSNNNPTTLLIFESSKQQDSSQLTREYVIHCSGYIINKSGIQLQYFTSNNNKSNLIQLGGVESINRGDPLNQQIVLLGTETGNILQLSHNSSSQKISQFPIQISTIGEPEIDVIVVNEENTNQLLQMYLGAKLELGLCNKKYTLFNKIITLEPRFIIVNNCNQDIVIAQNEDSFLQTVSPNQRIIFQILYNSKTKVRNPCQFINMNVSNNDYQSSSRLNINAVGIVYYQLRKKDNPQEKLYFSCDIRQEECSLYVIFNQLNQDQAPYKIEMLVQNLELEIQELQVILNSNNSFTYFAWDDPLRLQKSLNVELRIRDDPQGEYKPLKYVLYPDHIGLMKVYIFKPNKESKAAYIPIVLSILPKGCQKQIQIMPANQEQIKIFKAKPKQDFLKQLKQKNNLEFEDDNQQGAKSQSLQSESIIENSDKIENRINLKLTSFSLSLVHNSDVKKRPSEFFHFTCTNIEFVVISTVLNLVLQLRVQYINFDHNAEFFVQFPVVITPQKYALYHVAPKQLQQQQQQSDKYFFNVMIILDNRVSDIKLFQNITFELDPFEIRVEQLFIVNILEFVWAITSFKGKIQEFEKNQAGNYFAEKQMEILNQYEEEKENDYNNKHNSQSFVEFDSEWIKKKLPNAQLPIYICEIIISPIQLNLTVQMSGKGDLNMGNLAIFASIAQAVGVVLSDISEAPIFFKGWKIENCFDTGSGILNKMMQFYKQEGIKQIGSVIGSLSIIGNPIGLLNNISTGFKDFVDKPAAGLTQGPLETGLGLAQGAKSLISHTIAGAFSSVNKITGSFGSGLANLTLDEDYLRKRERQKIHKPKHLGEGLGQGARSIATGIYDGITGVFLKPIKGAREKGIKGVFTGTAKGLAGLIIKPITGVLDGMSQTAAGIQNTVSYFDDKPNNNRARNIRPVYGLEGYLDDFKPIDAEGFAMIHFLKNGALQNDRFIASYLIIPDVQEQENKFMLVITYENFIYMSFKTKKKVWILKTKDVTHLGKVPSGVKIQVNKPQKQLKNNYVTQIHIQKDLQDDVFEIMQTIWEQNRTN